MEPHPSLTPRSQTNSQLTQLMLVLELENIDEFFLDEALHLHKVHFVQSELALALEARFEVCCFNHSDGDGDGGGLCLTGCTDNHEHRNYMQNQTSYCEYMNVSSFRYSSKDKTFSISIIAFGFVMKNDRELSQVFVTSQLRAQPFAIRVLSEIRGPRPKSS